MRIFLSSAILKSRLQKILIRWFMGHSGDDVITKNLIKWKRIEYHLGVQKCAKLEKKGMFLVMLTNFGKDMTNKLRKPYAKNGYLGSISIPEKYVFRVCFESPFTRMISTLKYKYPPPPRFACIPFVVHYRGRNSRRPPRPWPSMPDHLAVMPLTTATKSRPSWPCPDQGVGRRCPLQLNLQI